jgi:hypothetical protein
MRLCSGTSSPLSGPPSKMPHSTAVRTSQLVKAGVSYWKRYKLPFISARYKWRGKNSQVQSARVYLSPEKFAAMTIAMWRMSILEITWSLSSHRTSVCIVPPLLRLTSPRLCQVLFQSYKREIRLLYVPLITHVPSSHSGLPGKPRQQSPSRISRGSRPK